MYSAQPQPSEIQSVRSYLKILILVENLFENSGTLEIFYSLIFVREKFEISRVKIGNN